MMAGISRALGVPAPRLRIPLWPLATAAFVLEGVLRPVGIQPPLHQRRMDFFIKSFKFTGHEARAVTGYQPTVTFEQGAARTASWYRRTRMI